MPTGDPAAAPRVLPSAAPGRAATSATATPSTTATRFDIGHPSSGAGQELDVVAVRCASAKV